MSDSKEICGKLVVFGQTKEGVEFTLILDKDTVLRGLSIGSGRLDRVIGIKIGFFSLL